MRTITPQFTAEKNRDDGFRIRSLLEIETDSSPLHLSDQPLSLGLRDYDPRVLEFSTIKSQLIAGENTIRTAAMSIILSNIPRIDASIIAGKKVIFCAWFDRFIPNDTGVIWTNLVNVTPTPTANDLTKSAGGSVWNAGAFGSEEIYSGGMSFQAGQTDKNIMCGLSSNDPDQDFDTIDFAMACTPTGVLQAWENGVNVWATGVPYTTNTILSVEINPATGVIEYKKDGVVQYTSLNSPTFPLFVDNSIFQVGAQILDVIVFAREIEALKMFVGTINAGMERDFYKVKFIANDIGQSFNKVIGDLLETTGHPNADPDDIGTMKPIVYGVVKNHRCLISQVGGITTLAADITDTYTGAIAVADTTSPEFSSSGTVIIGDEEISYTAITDTTIQGTITRGVGGTDASSHSRGDGVFEKTAMKAKAANHAVDAITNARVVPYGHTRKEAVPIQDLVSSTSLSLAELTFNDPITIARRVAIAVSQQPGVSLQQKFSGSADHAHIAPGNTTITYYLDSLGGTQSGGTNSNLPRWVDKSFASTGSVTGYGSFDFKITKQGIEQYNGAVKKIKSKIRCWTTKSGGVTINMKLYLGGVLRETKVVSVPEGSGNVATFETSFYNAASGYNEWLDFNVDSNNYIQVVNDGAIGVSSIFVSEVWWEVEYLPGFEVETIQDGTIATTGGTEVQLGGDSVAAFIGGPIIVDVQGYEDDGSGTFTGTPNQLIERPGRQIHHLLINHSNGVTPSNIDLDGSFADTQSFLPAEYKFGFAINFQIELESLLVKLAWQCWCRFFWFAGKAKLTHIMTRWTRLVNVTNTPTSKDLTKTGGGGVWNAGAFGTQAIRSGGMSFKAGQTDKNIMCGLSADDPDQAQNTIDFAIFCSPAGQIGVFENGVNVWATGVTYTTDTVLSVEIDPATAVIRYKKDGVLQYTSLNSPTFPLFIDNSIFDVNAQILDVTVLDQLSIDTDNDSKLINKRLAVKIRTKDQLETFNTIELKYNLDYTQGPWEDENAYQNEAEANDSPTIIRKKPGGWLAFAITDNDIMAADLADKIKQFYQIPRDIISFPAPVHLIDYEPGDAPEITTSRLGLSSKLTQVIGFDYIPPVPNARQNPQIQFECLDIE